MHALTLGLLQQRTVQECPGLLLVLQLRQLRQLLQSGLVLKRLLLVPFDQSLAFIELGLQALPRLQQMFGLPCRPLHRAGRQQARGAAGVQWWREIDTGPFIADTMTTADGKGIVALKGDKTNPDPKIEAKLQEFGRSAIPVNVLIVPGKDPIVAPEILSSGYLTELFNKNLPAK